VEYKEGREEIGGGNNTYKSSIQATLRGCRLRAESEHEHDFQKAKAELFPTLPLVLIELSPTDKTRYYFAVFSPYLRL
jgi:hypothetical protein